MEWKSLVAFHGSAQFLFNIRMEFQAATEIMIIICSLLYHKNFFAQFYVIDIKVLPQNMSQFIN